MRTSFSRRELYALGEMLGDSITCKEGGRIIYGGGGGGGGRAPEPQQTTSTTYQTNIPEYAKPYVETMLQGTQKQLFTTAPNATTGATEITGFQPYKAFGGTYDEDKNSPTYGKQLSYDPGKAVAGFQPLQETAQRGIAGMQLPGEFGQAADVTRAGILSAMGNQYQGGQFGNQFQAPQDYQTGRFNAQQVNAPQLQDFQMQGPANVNAPSLQQYQMGPAERVSADSFTQPGAASQYMSPYMQNVVDIQQREAQRQADIASTQRGAQAARSGAFGGSRAAIMDAEAARNLALQKGDIQAAGQQAAFQNAQQQFNAEQNARMQAALANQGAGLTVGQQNLGALLGIQQLGAGQNLQAQLANQGMGFNVGQQNLASRLQTQGLGAGQNLQAQLANQQQNLAAQQMREQSRQFGAGQGMTAAQQRAQYGLAGQQLGEQSRQFGAGYGLQNLQAGMQGAQQLANLGQAGLASQQGIYNLQNTVGAQQQALEQQKINQAMTDYANAQQYPLMQLGTMSNMLRGLPMQAQTTNQYVAAPNQMTQAIGTAGAAASLYNALKAEGGVIKEKKMASGGITSIPHYDVGGEVYADLMKMGPEELQEQIKSSSSEKVKEMAKALLKQKQMAGGGIVAFGGGGETNEEKAGEAEAKVGMEERLAQPPVVSTDGILGAGLAPKAPAQPAAPSTGIGTLEAVRDETKTLGARPLSEFMKEKQAAYKEQGVEAPGVEQRAKLMAERANAEDEANRNRWMRAAQFFSRWGSTPGATLVAGMTAVRDSVPDMINDAKEAKKIRMEIDKTIAGLDEATRLEKKGLVDEAYAEKMKLAEKTQALNLEIAKIQAQQERDTATFAQRTKEAELHLSGTKYTADMHLRGDELRVKSAAADRALTRAGTEEAKKISQFQTSVTQENRVLSDISREESGKAHQGDLATIKQYGMLPKDQLDKNPQIKEQLQTAKDRIAAREKSWDSQIANAKSNTDLMFARAMPNQNENKTGAGGKGTPPPLSSFQR